MKGVDLIYYGVPKGFDRDERMVCYGYLKRILNGFFEILGNFMGFERYPGMPKPMSKSLLINRRAHVHIYLPSRSAQKSDAHDDRQDC